MLIDFSENYMLILSNIHYIDSIQAAKVDSLNQEYFTLLISFTETLRRDKKTYGLPNVKQKSDTLELNIHLVADKNHSFNYFVHEKSGINIKFTGINL